MQLSRIPIVIDVDTGTDDAIAIISALLCQGELDIRAFTTVAGNVGVDSTSRNTLNLVRHLGFAGKVAVGAKSPLEREHVPATIHGDTGLGDVALPAATGAFYEKDGAETLYDEAVLAGGALQVLAVGPLTNVALAIKRHPDIVGLIEGITIMGGALRGGNITMASEFNIHVDPEAASLVFESGIPLTMIGLDVTHLPKLPPEVVARVKAANNPYAQTASQVLDYMIRRYRELQYNGPNLHDAIALCALLRPGSFTLEERYVAVECGGEMTRGMTVCDYSGVSKRRPNVRVAVDMDVDAFWAWLLDLLENA